MRRTGSILVALALVFMGLAALVPAPASAADASSSGAPSTEQIRQKHEAEFRRTHQDSAGNLRPDLWRAGVTQQQDMATTNMSGQQIPGQDGVGPKTAPGVVGATWSQIGPAPVRVDQEQNFQGAGPDSGEVGDVAIDPAGTTDRIVYIVSNDGGVWKTTNGDAAPNAVVWTPLTDNMPSNSMGAIALDPTNSSIVYAGTGNRFNNGFFKGVGLYRSTDGGATWAQPAGNGSLNNRAIYRIVLPSFNVVLVATNGGLFKSVDGGTSYGNNAPTYDNGLAVLAGDIVDLHLGTEGNGRVYASTRGGTLHRSTDSGSTFGGSLFDGNIPAGASYVSFSQATLDTKIIYANIQTPNVPNPPPPGSTQKDGRIFRTSNGDQANPTWANVAAGSANALGCQCGYDQTIGVDPQDNNTVYQGYQELYVTTNGGTSWPKVSASKIHWDHHALTFSPPSHRTGAPTRAWVGQDGGISYTSDRGANFSLPDEGGLATNLFRGLGIGTGSAVNRGYSFGGTQDTGTLHHTNTTPGTDWHLSIDGDGGQVAVDHCDAKHAMGSDNGFFISTPNINTTIFSQTNNGFGTSGTPTVTQVDNMAFDPNCGSRAYVGDAGNGFWQTTDNGANFTKIHTFPAHVVAMSQRVGSPNTMWVGLGDGTTQRSDNLNLGTTSTWTSHAVTGAPAGQQIGYPGGIAMDSADATGNTVVATFEGFTGTASTAPSQHVFRTTDGGTNWTDISGTDGAAADVLPDLPTHSVVIDTDTTPHGIIVSNDAGVLRTSDNGASWQRLGTGLPTVFAPQLQIDTGATPTLLRVGTYGRSVFELIGDARADLQMGKTAAPSPVNAGNDLTYTLTVKNNGPNDAQVVSMTDTLVGPSTYVSETHPAGWTCTTPAVGASSGIYNCTRPTLTVADGTQTFTVVVHTPPDTVNGTTQLNSAAVSSGTLDTNTTNNAATSSTVIQTRADLETIKTAPAGPVAPTTNMTYGIKVTNKGPSDAQTVSMTDVLPTGMAFLSETHPVGWNCTTPVVGAGGTVTCTTATLAALAVANFTITVHISPSVPSGTDSSNTATAASTTIDPDPTNNSSTAITRVACTNTLTGNFPSTLNLSGGSWCLSNATVGSVVTVSPGTLVIVTNSTLRSDFNANGSNNIAMCNTTVRGYLSISNAVGFVLIGDPGDDLCTGNSLSTVNLSSNRGGLELSGNPRILGNVSVTGNSGVGPFPDDSRPEIEANNMYAGLACSGNVPTASNDGQPNTVRGTRQGECGAAGF